jgi:hypothetical protein
VNQSSLKNFALRRESSALFSAAMPTLPSGRNVAINLQRLDETAHRAFYEKDEASLLRLDHPAQMFQLIELADVEFREDIPSAELDRFWTEEGDKFGILHPLGYSISDVIRSQTGWSAADTFAFKRFLMRPSTTQIFRLCRRDLACMRKLLELRACQDWPLPTDFRAEDCEAGPSWHV